MKRVLTGLIVTMTMVAVCGCDGAKKRKMTDTAEPEPAALEDVTDSEGSAERTAEQPEPQPTVEPVAPDEPVVAPAPMGPRTHVVQPGDTLFKLARMYYNNDQRMWRQIWQANKDKLPDPNKLTVGMELVIP